MLSHESQFRSPEQPKNELSFSPKDFKRRGIPLDNIANRIIAEGLDFSFTFVYEDVEGEHHIPRRVTKEEIQRMRSTFPNRRDFTPTLINLLQRAEKVTIDLPMRKDSEEPPKVFGFRGLTKREARRIIRAQRKSKDPKPIAYSKKVKKGVMDEEVIEKPNELSSKNISAHTGKMVEADTVFVADKSVDTSKIRWEYKEAQVSYVVEPKLVQFWNLKEIIRAFLEDPTGAEVELVRDEKLSEGGIASKIHRIHPKGTLPELVKSENPETVIEDLAAHYMYYDTVIFRYWRDEKTRRKAFGKQLSNRTA